ncbi:MAG: nitroreductase family protein [Halobacteriales archaeon]
MDVSEAIETRLEVREYADEPIDDATKRAVLNAARLAPSGKNLQHWAFVLLDEPVAVSELADLSTTGSWVRDAAFAVVVLTDPSYAYHEIDAGRAVTQMQLEAWSRGVGSCIYTGFDEAGLREFLESPAALRPTLVAGFGRPTRPLSTFVGEKDRMSLEELVHHGRFGASLTL